MTETRACYGTTVDQMGFVIIYVLYVCWWIVVWGGDRRVGGMESIRFVGRNLPASALGHKP